MLQPAPFIAARPAALAAPGLPSPLAQLAPARSPSRAAHGRFSAAAQPPASTARSLSPTWRCDSPSQELLVSNFHRLLQGRDEEGAAALLRRAPGLANAAKGGLPPLHVAVRVKSMPLAQLLLASGADARAADASGRTAGAVAAAAGAAGLAALLESAAASASP